MINKLYLSKSVEGCLARIELRDCLIKIQDGLAGFAAVGATGASGTTSLTLETPVLNTSVTDAVPVVLDLRLWVKRRQSYTLLQPELLPEALRVVKRATAISHPPTVQLGRRLRLHLRRHWPQLLFPLLRV